MKRKIEAILKPYRELNEQFTQIPNTMITYIEDPYILKVYLYLCMRYNSKYDYAFPSLDSISNECKIGLTKVKASIKWLVDEGIILKGKFKDAKKYANNIYYIRYLCIEDEEITKDDSRDSDNYKDFRKKVFKRDNFVCQICGKKKNLVSHHINGYNWCKEGRLDTLNAITLCEECHNTFHDVYGKGNNTWEQFKEFLLFLINEEQIVSLEEVFEKIKKRIEIFNKRLN